MILNQEVIKIQMNPHSYRNGQKLMEHSYLDSDFATTFEYQLTKDGMNYKSRVVWAGDIFRF